jgi:transcriptional regulator NrdR family protein
VKCPACNHKTEVEATRFGDTRVRRCPACGHRFMTLETIVKALPKKGPT